MSKQLYINNKRLVIDEEQTYFPFSYKINTLEDVSIIGVPVSKTVTIPRCSQNDEIFGYIGELTRKTVGYTDNLVGVSFNQIKKAVYTLYNNSELISTGLLIVTNLTKDSYEVMLNDIMIDKIETLGTKKLNEIDLYNSNDQIINFRSTTANVLLNLNPSDGFVPTINNREFKDTGTNFLCGDLKTGQLAVTTLTKECTPINIESIKNHNIDWSSSISNVIKSINHAGLTQIEVDPLLNDTFNEVYLRGNAPKNKEIILEGSLNPYNGSKSSINIPIITTPSLSLDNGKYYIELGLDIKFQSTSNSDIANDFLSSETINGVTTNYYNSTLPDGGYMGTYYVKTRFVSRNNQNNITSSSLYLVTAIPLYKNVNVTEIVTPNSGNDYIGSLRLQSVIPIEHDYYMYIDPYLYSVKLECSLSYSNPTNTSDFTYVLGTGSAAGNPDVYCTFPSFKSKASTLKFTKLEFRTGDYINASSIMPAITIKEFLLGVVKYLNLDLIVNGSNLKIVSKSYSKTSKVLIIDSESTEINTNILDMSSIKFSNSISENTVMKDYETSYKKIYGEKQVNTGYNIKENVKEVKFDVSIPFLIVPTNNYSYDTFLRYFNGGYSKCSYGDVTGFDDKLALGYLQLNQRTIFVNDDAPFETGGYFSGYSIQPTEEKFCLYNPFIWYDSTMKTDSSKYKLHNNISYKNNIIGNFYTFSPYMFSDVANTVVIKSLDFNKGLVNFANIKDSNYADSTTVYNRFHKNIISDKYDVNTHIMKTKIYMDGQPDTRKIYNVKNSEYIISNLVEFDPTKPDMYEVELMKVNTPENYQTPYNDVEVLKSYISAEQATSVSFTSATLNGIVKNKYGETYNDPTVTEKGFVYSYYNVNPFIGEVNCVKVISSTSGATFNYSLTNLTPNYPIIYKAYIKTTLGTFYSNNSKFTLLSAHTPYISLPTVSNLSNFAFNVSGSISELGGLTLINKGIIVSRGTIPFDLNNSDVYYDLSGGNSINISFKGLLDNHTYYINTFATNEYGTTYGSNSTYSVTTPLYVPPIEWTVTTLPLTSNKWSASIDAIFGGGHIGIGNMATVTEMGLVYSTSNTTPNGSWSKVTRSNANVTTDFQAYISGLSPTTTYYVYAYGKSNTGEYRFGTLQTMTTENFTNSLVMTAEIGYNNLINYPLMGGYSDILLINTTNNCIAIPEQYGYYISTSANPKVTGTKIVSSQTYYGNNPNFYREVVKNLRSGILYYFCSYETHTRFGTIYSADVSCRVRYGTGSYRDKSFLSGMQQIWDVTKSDYQNSFTRVNSTSDILNLIDPVTLNMIKLPSNLVMKSVSITRTLNFKCYLSSAIPVVAVAYDRVSDTTGNLDFSLYFGHKGLFYGFDSDFYLPMSTNNGTHRLFVAAGTNALKIQYNHPTLGWIDNISYSLTASTHTFGAGVYELPSTWYVRGSNMSQSLRLYPVGGGSFTNLGRITFVSLLKTDNLGTTPIYKLDLQQLS